MACASRGVQGGAAILRAGTPHGRPGAPQDVGCGLTPSCEAPCPGAPPTDPLFAGLLGMALGVIHGLRRLAARRAVPQVVWHIGAPLRDGPAEGPWAVRHQADERHLHGLPHGPAQGGKVWRGRGQHTAGQEAFPGEAGPQAPPPRRANVGLEAIAGHDEPALGVGETLQTGGVSAGEGEPCVVREQSQKRRICQRLGSF